MLTVPWSSKSGWGAPKISPYAPLQLDPSSTVLHYAPCLFEGMKAYKDDKGVARLFRPDKNMERMNRSAARLAFPVRNLSLLNCASQASDAAGMIDFHGGTFDFIDQETR